MTDAPLCPPLPHPTDDTDADIILMCRTTGVVALRRRYVVSNGTCAIRLDIIYFSLSEIQISTTEGGIPGARQAGEI